MKDGVFLKMIEELDMRGGVSVFFARLTTEHAYTNNLCTRGR